MQAETFEPMSVGQILDRVFRIYRRNFVRFIVIVAVIQVPVNLLVMVSEYAVSSGANAQQPYSEPPTVQALGDMTSNRDVSGSQPRYYENEQPQFPILTFVGVILGVTLAVLGNALCQGALTKSVSESYLNNVIGVGEAYRYVWPRLMRLILAGFLVSLVVGIGFLLLVVPGIIFALWFSLTVPTIIVEDLGITEAMGRSKRLVAGNLGKVMVVGFLVLLIATVINMAFGFFGGAIVGPLARQSYALAFFVTNLLNVAAAIIAAPIGAAAYILLYYDLRIRKEGFDLEMLAESLGAEQNTGEAGYVEP
ncbi:MAG: YciC family protein [Planctomycetota bacterium]